LETVRILLVDDHVLFRKGLAALLTSRSGFAVVGEANDGREAMSEARDLVPDVILMDVRMPVCDGLTATKQIMEEMPGARIVILTVSDDDEDVFQAIKSGALGYLLKDSPVEDLIAAIQGAMQGGPTISPGIASRILEHYRAQGQLEQSPVQLALSPREQEILACVADGLSDKEVSNRLSITIGTVKNHVHNIIGKLHVQNRAEAVARALREGLITLGGEYPRS